MLAVITMGKMMDAFRPSGISFGSIWILFMGMAAAQTGVPIDLAFISFVKEIGLSLFILMIGLEVGSAFFDQIGKGGLRKWMLAILVVLGGTCVACLFSGLCDVERTTMAGILAGAVSNTPSLGAAQASAGVLSPEAARDMTLGYALAYPGGILGILAIVLILQQFFGIKASVGKKETSFPFPYMLRLVQVQIPALHVSPAILTGLTVLAFFALVGFLAGKVPFPIPGLSMPFRLGTTGGTLLVGVLVSALAPRLRFSFLVDKAVSITGVKQWSLQVFMACIGLGVGSGFLNVIVRGGWIWALQGFVITVLPCALMAAIAVWWMKMPFEEVVGLLTVSTTNSPVFAYCDSLPVNRRNLAMNYAALYPLVLILRICLGQFFVLW